MKTTQYVRQEKVIASTAASDIRERWMWGLRLLRDPEAMSSPKSLRHGVTDQLIAAAAKAGIKLTDREIRWRLQAARTYQTEAEIGSARSDFATWTELREAGFPAYKVPEGALPADHRTPAERDHDRARALLDRFGDQGTLFPLADFEPVETTLKDLQAYAEQMRELTDRFAERDRKRQAYLDRMIEAVGGDLSVTWQEAHDRLGDGTEIGEVAA